MKTSELKGRNDNFQEKKKQFLAKTYIAKTYIAYILGAKSH